MNLRANLRDETLTQIYTLCSTQDEKCFTMLTLSLSLSDVFQNFCSVKAFQCGICISSQVFSKRNLKFL